jgi:mannose-6-phosphate isomerase-like protein (cupin superfamily)
VTNPVSRTTAEHYVWGDVSDGWRLVDDESLSVIEEEVPAGAGETWHVHRRAQQFFYILEGQAVMCTDDGDVPLAAGEGLTIMPGTVHRFANRSDAPVRFLVTSTPTTRGDRHPAEPRAAH